MPHEIQQRPVSKPKQRISPGAPDSAPFLTTDRTLTDHAWRSDRSMRGSGFDPGFRFGPLNPDTLNDLPVCLNTLLRRMEIDIAAIRKIIGATNTRDVWLERAAQRRQYIGRRIRDEAAGRYSDDPSASGLRSRFVFAPTFRPLRAGLTCCAVSSLFP